MTANGTGRPPLLQVVGATKTFPGVKALSGVDFDLRHGEVLALVGENGAGKSTLMKLLSGIYTPDAGEFFLDGERVEFSAPKQAQELGISIIHQEFNLMPDLTIAQNLFIGREPRSGGVFLRGRALERTAKELLDRLGLALDPNERVSELTVAKQQMVEIAKALSYDARVLIMDEPTAALNDAEVDALFALIRRFTTPETGVIYISHRMHELKEISDRITVLRDGEYVATVDTESTPPAEVISLMVGRTIVGEDRPAADPDASTEAILSVRGLGTKHLLRDVTFDLRRGEILGFAGLMGAGRTEVARAIVGADRITAGTITLNGRDVSISSPADAAARGIGYLSEDRKKLGVLLERNVRENVVLSSLADYVRALGWIDSKRIEQTGREYVSKLRIKTPSTTAMVKNLSGGNQQKVVIAKWLAKDCDVLIFDEPTRGIDVGAKDEIYALLRELAAQGKSIIMISSELPEVLRMSHRIAVMCEGRLTAVLDNAEATQENIMDYATRFSADETVQQ
ncbi:ribose transport system ATP-binding protein [Microbacteriaceae bacterium SG_E_30_P1]|uniref:Ribose transport system ATP-binding protein n=1 Tax=Antiquaquibacter oligotrophicus TaxID=2880260 RepID=A0ABT6KT38_9MICO|nr:sugar ABC transporter ATP-binding protein [Antiquaquibacter oligotrophicus]MDH6182349.1 ribose transport system ATP-binding protein [Antiquaquibacter oligotrophicus]UDF11998.1 sugar ABC transporter ATP-binding protein [Antiquaquibacter oligotrophicus]